MNEDIIVTIDSSQYGGEYYISEQDVKYLGSDGSNSSRNQIYLYNAKKNYTAYIVINSDGSASYRNTSSYNSYSVTINSVSFNPLASYYKYRDTIPTLFYAIMTAFVIFRLVKK